ncbi:hypothetical protein IMZ48_41425, partial [Candidatus Bathyarchaeota archaeon]|nr:hypothetical protein [Candidatus Bathyarchaeota archaeon]
PGVPSMRELRSFNWASYVVKEWEPLAAAVLRAQVPTMVSSAEASHAE